MIKQKTIKKEIALEGAGLHTGKTVRLRLMPAPVDSGIIFHLNGVSIPAQFRYAHCGQHYSLLRKGNMVVHTVEHLLSALYGARISNCIAELQGGNEVPFFDGSSHVFARELLKTGMRIQNKTQLALHLKKPVVLQNGNKLLAAIPSQTFNVFYLLSHKHAKIGAQSFFLDALRSLHYLKEVSPARTFATMEEAKMLVKSGFVKGGTMASAVLVGKTYSAPLRFKNEFARHKCLDLMGDLALLGTPLAANIIALRTGHYENHLLVKTLCGKKNTKK